jgi:hypothetical protein
MTKALSILASAGEMNVLAEASEVAVAEKVKESRERLRVWYRDGGTVAHRATFLVPATPG